MDTYHLIKESLAGVDFHSEYTDNNNMLVLQRAKSILTELQMSIKAL